jgi:phage terminase small subunit
MPGPRKKPAEARAREGVGPSGRGQISHRATPPVIVVESRELDPTPPPHLAPDAAAVYREVVTVMTDARILDSADFAIVEAFAVQLTRLRQAQAMLDENITPQEEAALEQRLRELEALTGAAKSQVANEMRAGERVRSSTLNAIADLELRVGGMEAYLASRRQGGHRVSIGSQGQCRPSPWLAVERAAVATVRLLANELALTPGARVELGLKLVLGRSLEHELEASIGRAARRPD